MVRTLTFRIFIGFLRIRTYLQILLNGPQIVKKWPASRGRNLLDICEQDVVSFVWVKSKDPILINSNFAELLVNQF